VIQHRRDASMARPASCRSIGCGIACVTTASSGLGHAYFAETLRRARTAAPVMPALSPSLLARIWMPSAVPVMA